MLNLYKNSIKKKKINFNIDNNIKSNTIKNFPASTREWKDSIYTFNKNYLKLIPEVSKSTIKLIRSYLYLYNVNIENKLRKSNVRKRSRKLSSNRIYVSNGLFKHTNNRVIITIYIYNRQKMNFSFFIDRKFNKFFAKQIINSFSLFKSKIQNHIEKLEINNKIVTTMLSKEKNEIIFNKYKSLYKKLYYLCFSKKTIKKLFRRYRKYFLYKQMLFINKSKFNYNYLSYLTFLLKRVFNKNIQFNIINLNYFYLNSDIFTESILLKIRRNRRKIIRKLKYLIIKSNINPLNKLMVYEPITKNIIDLDKRDYINYIILNSLYKNEKSLKETVFSLIKYKRTSGVRLEAKGRLTRRYTASRTVTKLRYKGNLINADSSYLGLSSVLLKGNLRSNVQYTKLKSKTRIGSFGLKGWISGY